MDIKDGIRYAGTIAGYSELRSYQAEMLQGFAAGKDGFMCVPTGGGKSAVFECAPYLQHFLNTEGKPDTVKIDTTVLIISPLVSLMRTQCAELRERGLAAAYVTDVSMENQTSEDASTFCTVDQVRCRPIFICNLN